MFKFVLVASVLVAAVSAQFYQQQPKYAVQQPIPILRLSSDILPDGRFQWAYETGNGIAAQAIGDQKPGGADGPIQSIQGEYSYTADDGTPVKISYVADENGYQPVGNVLPTPPPIPEAIRRALEYIARSNPNSFKK